MRDHGGKNESVFTSQKKPTIQRYNNKTMRHLITSQQEPMTASSGFGFKQFDYAKKRN